MPKYQVELTNGQKFVVDADGPPTEADIVAFASQQQALAAPGAAPIAPAAAPQRPPAPFPPSFLSQASQPSLLERGRQFLSPLLGPTATQTLNMQRDGTEAYEALPAWKREGIMGAMSHSPVELIPDVTAPQIKAPSPGLAPLVDLYNRLNREKAATINTVKGFANFAASPPGLVTAGAALPATGLRAVTGLSLPGLTASAGPAFPTLARTISGGYAADMALKTPEAAQHAGELSVTGTPQEQANANVGLAAQVLMPGLLGLHALKGGEPRGQETQGRKEVLTMGPVPDWLNPAVLEAQRGGPYPLAPLDPRQDSGPIVSMNLPTPEQMRQPPAGMSITAERLAQSRQGGIPLSKPNMEFPRQVVPPNYPTTGGIPFVKTPEFLADEAMRQNLAQPNAPYPFNNDPVGSGTFSAEGSASIIPFDYQQMSRPPSGLGMAVDRPVWQRGDPLNPLTIDPTVSFDRTGPPSGGQAADAPATIPWSGSGEHPYSSLTENQLRIMRESLIRDMSARNQVTASPWLKPKEPVYPPAVSREGSTAPVEAAAQPSDALGPPPRPTLTESPASTEPVRAPARELTPEEMTNVRHDLAGTMIDNLKSFGATPEQLAAWHGRRKAIGLEVARTGDMTAFQQNLQSLKNELSGFVKTAKARKAESAPTNVPSPVGEQQTQPSGGKPTYPLSRKGGQFVDAQGRPVGPDGNLVSAPPPLPAPPRDVQQLDRPLRMQGQPPPLTVQRQQMARIGVHEGQSVHEAVGAIARSPEVSPTDRALASFLHEHFPDVLRMTDLSLGKSRAETAAFDPMTQRAHTDVDTRLDPVKTTLHEGAHAALYWALEHPVTEVQRMAAKEIGNLMEQARAALNPGEVEFVNGPMQRWAEDYNQGKSTPNQLWDLYERAGVPANRYSLHYALLNQHEFVAGVFNKPEFRQFLDSIKAQGPSLFRRIVDAFKRLLGVTQDSVLDRAFDAMWHVGEDRGSLNESRVAGGAEALVSAPPPLRSGPPPLPLNAYVTDAAAALPDLKPKDVANRENSIKFASERVPGLGRLMGGKARITTAQDEAVATWYAERHGVGPAIASAVGTQIHGKLDKVFGTSANGDLRVVPRVDGMSLKPSDVFETLQKDPTAYQLTPSQRQAYDTVIRPLLDRLAQLVDKNGLASVVDDAGQPYSYFPRIATKLLDPEQTAGARNTRVGGKQSFQKPRWFDTEREGWQAGMEYEPSLEKRITTAVNQVYRALADKRLAEDPVLGGRTRGALLDDLKMAFAPELASGQMTKEQLTHLADIKQSKGSVWSPAFFGKIFDPAIARTLNREFTAEQFRGRKALVWANGQLKAVKLGLDLGASQIQGLPTLFYRPDVWGKSLGRSIVSMADVDHFPNYMRQNKEAVRELAEYGSSVGQLQEHMSGLGGQGVSGVPIVGAPFRMFGRQFQTFLDVAKVEMWKAWRDVTPRSEWPTKIREIESILLSGRSESAMVPHGRSLIERFALLAPTYYRGSIDFVTSVATAAKDGKLSSSATARAMGAFVVGSTALYVAMAKNAGMSDDEIVKRLNPARADFMMWDVEDRGLKYNIGMGGVFRSYLRLFGNMAKTSVEHPGNWASLSSEKNPITRWLRGHGAPVPTLAWTAFSGRDFMGKPATASTVAGEMVSPMVVSQEGGRVDKAGGFIGLNVQKKHAPTADELSGGRLGDMPMWERMGLGKQVKAEKPAQSPVEKMMTEQRAAEYGMERVVALEKALPATQRTWLKTNGLSLAPYETSIEKHGVRVPLTADEQARLTKLNEKWHAVFIGRLMARPDVAAMTQARRQDLLNRMMAHAREAARDELVMGLPKARAASGRGAQTMP